MSTSPQRHLISAIAIWTLWAQIYGVAIASERDVTAFIHATLVPMTTQTVTPDQTVVVDGSRIACVGPSSRTKIPPNSTVINCQNAFLMPGLADMICIFAKTG